MPFSGSSNTNAKLFLLCRNIGTINIQPYMCELDYHIFFLWKFEYNWITFARSIWHMNMAFIYGATRENSETIRFITILVIPQILESYKDDVCHPQSWRGHMRSFWEISPFSCGKQLVVQIHPVKALHNRHHVQIGGKNSHPNWASYVKGICSLLWLLHLSNTRIRSPKQAMPT